MRSGSVGQDSLEICRPGSTQALAAVGISVHQRGLAVCLSFELFGRRSGLGWTNGHGFLLLQRRKGSSRLEFRKRNDRKMVPWTLGAVLIFLSFNISVFRKRTGGGRPRVFGLLAGSLGHQTSHGSSRDGHPGNRETESQ